MCKLQFFSEVFHSASVPGDGEKQVTGGHWEQLQFLEPQELYEYFPRSAKKENSFPRILQTVELFLLKLQGDHP